jgi:outer membrane receptor protein involved in Fe transport
LFADRVRLNADYFSSRFYNIVTFAFCSSFNNFCNLTSPVVPSGFGYFFNTDIARARGLNLSGETRFTRWLNLAGNYTYNDSRVIKASEPFDPTELPGNHLIRRPVNSGSLTMNAAYRRLNVTLGGYFTGVRTDSDFLSMRFTSSTGPVCIGPCLTHNPGYARLDLSGSYRVGHGVTFYARATNLFDKQYQDALGYPALGRDMRAGVKYTFSGRN